MGGYLNRAEKGRLESYLCLWPRPFRFRFFFWVVVSVTSSRGRVLRSAVGAAWRAGVVGVVGAKLAAGRVACSGAVMSVKSRTMDWSSLI